MALDAALTAIRRGDHGAARDALIASWRKRRSPELAAAIAILDAKAPDETSRAIARIVTPRAASSLANLEKLAKLDDPRLAGWAIEALVKLPFTAAGAREFLVAVARTAARHDDPRLAMRAAEIATALSTRIGRLAVRTELLQIVDAAVAKLPQRAKPTAAEQELLASLEGLQGDRRSAEALLAEIYANPADDAPRLVYADVLSAMGDPRGEFIVLQIERGAAEPSARERDLLKQHGKAWLGDLAPVLAWGKGYSKTEFRRGFVGMADIILSVGRKLKPILEHPAWATVEEIAGLFDDDSGLLVKAPLRALHTLEVHVEALPKLAARAEKLAAVRTIDLPGHGELPTAKLLRQAFPHVATLRAPFGELTAAEVAAYTALGVEHVELRALSLSRGLLAKLVGTPAPVARLSVRVKSKTATLVRDAKGRYAVAKPKR